MASAALVATSPEAAMTALQELRQKDEERVRQQGKGFATTTFVNDVKNSLLFQYNWADLLSAAPISLALMGACFRAARSPLATAVFLTDSVPEGGFKYLAKVANPSLKGCLAQVANTGRIAFRVAEKEMGSIKEQSLGLQNEVNECIAWLDQLPHPNAQDELVNSLERVKDASDSCSRSAKTIESNFNNWLLMVMELHEASVQQEQTTADKEQQNFANLAKEEARRTQTESSLKNAEKAADELAKQMKTSEEAFKKASDNCPGPWESIAMNFVSNLAQQGTQMMSAALPMMMSSMTGGMVGGPPGLMGQQQSQQPQQGMGGGLTPNVTPQDAADPAYYACLNVSGFVTGLQNIVEGGKDDGVDWKALTDAKKNGDSDASGIGMIEVSLEHQLNNTPFTDSEPSTQLKRALTNVLKVAQELQAAAKKLKGLTNKELAADSEDVQRWQETVRKAKKTILALQAAAKSMPGAPPGQTPMLKQPTQSAPGAAPAQTAALSEASEQLKITQSAYAAAQEHYQKATENVSKVESDLAKIKGELAKLKSDQMSLADVKNILVQCIAILVQLKAQIDKLSRFFSAISVMVDRIVTSNVKKFTQGIEGASKTIMAGYSLLDFLRQSLFNQTLMLRSYFSLFNTISSMYVKMSIENVTPGLNLVDELSKSVQKGQVDNGDEILKQLEDFSNKAQENIRLQIEKTQKSITSTLSERVSSLEKDTKLLPLAPEAQKAIAQGAEKVTKTITEGFDNYKAPATQAPTPMVAKALAPPVDDDDE